MLEIINRLGESFNEPSIDDKQSDITDMAK